MMVLSDGERISIIRSAVLIQYTRVMDRRTDRQTDGIGVPYTRYSYMLSRVIKSNTLISQPHSHFSRLPSRHWDRSMSQLLTSRDVGSLPSSRRSDGPHSVPAAVSHGAAIPSDTMQLFCTTASHQVMTSGHQWNSFESFA